MDSTSTSNSKGNPNSLTPYDNFKECAQGLCNIYCPQWCSYPPPDPDPDPDSDSATTFSPLVIAVIGILASAFLLVSYYAIITKYCRRRRPGRRTSSNIEFQEHGHEDQIWQQQVGGVEVGLDETLINSITVFKYNKLDRLVEGTECSVCLNEFEENENLRLLPKCCHAFHPSCIDVWLKSHTNCPLCRANAVPTYVLPVPVPPPPPPASSSSSSSSIVVNASALQIQPPRPDLILMLENERIERSSHSNGEFFIANTSITGAAAGLLDEERQIRRSISLGTFSSNRSSLLVADILKIEEEEDDDDDDQEVCRSDAGVIGSSEGNHKSNSGRRNPESFRAPATVRRSFSTGRFYFHKTS